MSTGFLWLYWGNEPRLLSRSQESAKLWHPDLPQNVVNLGQGTMLDKLKMFELSPFDITIYLDSDTVVMGNLNHAIQTAMNFDIAMSICEYPWAGRYTDPKLRGTDIIEYNAGVVFFNKSQFVSRVFETAIKFSKTIDSSIKYGDVHEPCNDQACFALAFNELGPPFVLPYNYNFRPQWHKSVFPPIKIWHDVREPFKDVNKSPEHSLIHLR